MPIREISLANPSEPLSEKTDVVLTKESSEQNIMEVKQETTIAPVEDQQDQFGLVNIPPLPDTSHTLPDATTNMLVDLPGVSTIDSPMDVTITVPTIDIEGEPTAARLSTLVSTTVAKSTKSSQVVLAVQNVATAVPCSIVLTDVSVKLKGKTSVVFPPSEKEMYKAKVCLQRVDQTRDTRPQLRERKRQRTQGNRPTRKAAEEAKYVLTDATSGEDIKSDEKLGNSNKSTPSSYRLAAHRYMVAKKQGLIEEPKTRTHGLKFTKPMQATSTDSEATVEYLSDSAPPPRKHRKCQKPRMQGKLVTKSFVLRKDGKGTQSSRKPPK